MKSANNVTYHILAASYDMTYDMAYSVTFSIEAV